MKSTVTNFKPRPRYKELETIKLPSSFLYSLYPLTVLCLYLSDTHSIYTHIYYIIEFVYYTILSFANVTFRYYGY
jgi:hypothetical protein